MQQVMRQTNLTVNMFRAEMDFLYALKSAVYGGQIRSRASDSAYIYLFTISIDMTIQTFYFSDSSNLIVNTELFINWYENWLETRQSTSHVPIRPPSILFLSFQIFRRRFFPLFLLLRLHDSVCVLSEAFFSHYGAPWGACVARQRWRRMRLAEWRRDSCSPLWRTE